nr:putative maintenance function [Saccharomycopsis selenospora]
MSAVITSVDIKEYCSHIPEHLIVDILKQSKCDNSGVLELILKPGKKLTQKGPYLLPPIRWLGSFEYNAEFYIVCKVEKVDSNVKT